MPLLPFCYTFMLLVCENYLRDWWSELGIVAIFCLEHIELEAEAAILKILCFFACYLFGEFSTLFVVREY